MRDLALLCNALHDLTNLQVHVHGAVFHSNGKKAFKALEVIIYQ